METVNSVGDRDRWRAWSQVDQTHNAPLRDGPEDAAVGAVIAIVAEDKELARDASHGQAVSNSRNTSQPSVAPQAALGSMAGVADENHI